MSGVRAQSAHNTWQMSSGPCATCAAGCQADAALYPGEPVTAPPRRTTGTVPAPGWAGAIRDSCRSSRAWSSDQVTSSPRLDLRPEELRPEGGADLATAPCEVLAKSWRAMAGRAPAPAPPHSYGQAGARAARATLARQVSETCDSALTSSEPVSGVIGRSSKILSGTGALDLASIWQRGSDGGP